MSISRQNLTAIIVTFKSENVIHQCIKSIDKEIKIIVVDNSNNAKFKKNIEEDYENVSCISSKKNLGMGAGNNLGIKSVKTDFALILNPDVILDPNAINEIIEASKKIESFGIIAPIEINQNFPNYKMDNKKNYFNNLNPFSVKSVDGFAMLLNLKRLNQLYQFEYFDENIFMYLENDDLCRRLIDKKEKIYIIPKSKVKHLGAKGVNEIYKYEVELSRNWHWIWSKFYFNRKYYGYFFALINGFPSFISSSLKFIFYLLINNHKKKNFYLKRMSGFVSALLGIKSYYRPKIDDQ